MVNKINSLIFTIERTRVVKHFSKKYSNFIYMLRMEGVGKPDI